MDAVARHLPAILQLKYGPPEARGWGPSARQRAGYANPDDWYEATIYSLVTEQTRWLDVGCGSSTFPFNGATARVLADRCKLLVGLDPSDNIEHNPFVHQRVRCLLQEYRTDQQFDLITLRMVAEHITDPFSAVNSLSRLTAPGGLVVVYTVYKWSPAAVLAAITPQKFHYAAARFLWNAAQRDVFPTAYRMNTRRTLAKLFTEAGFLEQDFRSLDDCRTFSNWQLLSTIELKVWKLFRMMGLPYPERCILAIYRKMT